MEAAIEELKRAVGRRLSRIRALTEAWVPAPRIAMVLERAVGQLDAAETWADLQGLARTWMRELDRASAGASIPVGNLMGYLHSLAERTAPAYDLRLRVEDLLPASVLGWELSERLAAGMRGLRPDAQAALLRWEMEFLDTWYPCAPSLHEGRYEVVLDEELWSEVPVKDLGPEDTRQGRVAPLGSEGEFEEVLGQKARVDRYAEAHGLLQEIVGPAPGLCVASFSIAERAVLVGTDTVRDLWPEILDLGCAEDVLIWPLWPVQAGWALSHFHHGGLQIGRLRGPWPHRVTIE